MINISFHHSTGLQVQCALSPLGNTAIAGAFLLMRESLSKTSEGQETLNRISAAFGKILGPVFAVIEKVALPLFEGFALVIEKVASGFNRFAKFLGISSEKIEEASRASSTVLQEAYDEEEARQEELTKKTEEESQKRIDATQREADKIKTLISPTMMGDRFKMVHFKK